MPTVLQDLISSPAPEARPARLRYLARQAILNHERQAVAYELLYRGGEDVSAIIATGQDEDASQDTLDSSIIIGLDVLCGQRLAYFNCTRELLLGPDLRFLPAHRVVLEILEYVQPEAAVLKACRELKDAGFLIALDDFVPTAESRKFLPFADILKVDMRSTNPEQRQSISSEFGGRLSLLAEKVETEEEFAEVRAGGFDLFQGYYFGMPELFMTPQVSTERLNTLRLAGAVYQPVTVPVAFELAVK